MTTERRPLGVTSGAGAFRISRSKNPVPAFDVAIVPLAELDDRR